MYVENNICSKKNEIFFQFISVLLIVLKSVLNLNQGYNGTPKITLQRFIN